MIGTLCLVITVYWVICLVRIILSWLPMDDGGGLFSAINTVTYALTEPVFATFRNVLPRPGDLPIDLAPAVVILGLGLIRALLGC